jgi:hypothetical protein
MIEPEHSDAIPLELLAQTLARFVDPTAQITQVTYADLKSGMSGASVRRYRIIYTTGAQPAVASLVTKVATRHEWNVLLEYWLSDSTQTAWVQHYIRLVMGEGIDA